MAVEIDSKEASIPAQEERLLSEVQRHLLSRPVAHQGRSQRYNDELIALRDQVADTSLEDVPALVAHMERVQSLAAVQAGTRSGVIDLRSPYFGHLRLQEWDEDADAPRQRDIYIGRATYIDIRSGIRIVDWRNAPVSQLYYRYAEGSTYDERFGDRDVEGEVLVRRSVTIESGRLVRIAAPQGIFVHDAKGAWQRLEPEFHALSGGQGSATRPGDVARGLSELQAGGGRPGDAARAPAGQGGQAGEMTRGVLGVGPGGQQRIDRHLPVITGLIDPRQFELITAPDAGVVVIQGGAGSGKTTIGLHRMAWLAYADPQRFQPSRMRVVTYGEALAAYISEVLPALGVGEVEVLTVPVWARKERERAFPWLDVPSLEDAPSPVTRLKKHPALLKDLERRAALLKAERKGAHDTRDVVRIWAELLTDLPRLLEIFAREAYDPLTPGELRDAHAWCTERCSAVLDYMAGERGPRQEAQLEAVEDDVDGTSPRKGRPDQRIEIPVESIEVSDEGVVTVGEPDETDDEEGASQPGIEAEVYEDDEVVLDVEDDVLLVRASQLLRVRRRKKKSHLYSHLFIDEAQDLSPIELAMLLDQVTAEKSVTLAGDTSQRLYLHNGFEDWNAIAEPLHLPYVVIEPLRIAYRSTREILEVAHYAMGPLAVSDPPVAPRSGAPVEVHRFAEAGASVAFLAETLNALLEKEPRATVAVLARHPEQSELYYQGLKMGRVPMLRRVRAADFAFRPGVDVTEIRQVKGLEFDYVIIVEANASSFPADDESRHLFHIGATRAAYQLWLIVTGGQPSPLIPPELVRP